MRHNKTDSDNSQNEVRSLHDEIREKLMQLQEFQPLSRTAKEHMKANMNKLRGVERAQSGKKVQAYKTVKSNLDSLINHQKLLYLSDSIVSKLGSLNKKQAKPTQLLLKMLVEEGKTKQLQKLNNAINSSSTQPLSKFLNKYAEQVFTQQAEDYLENNYKLELSNETLDLINQKLGASGFRDEAKHKFFDFSVGYRNSFFWRDNSPAFKIKTYLPSFAPDKCQKKNADLYKEVENTLHQKLNETATSWGMSPVDPFLIDCRANPDPLSGQDVSNSNSSVSFFSSIDDERCRLAIQTCGENLSQNQKEKLDKIINDVGNEYFSITPFYKEDWFEGVAGGISSLVVLCIVACSYNALADKCSRRNNSNAEESLLHGTDDQPCLTDSAQPCSTDDNYEEHKVTP